VALFAPIKVRSSRELSVVLITVAVRTLLELDLEQRVLPFWDMALRTLQIGMLALQWISSSGVLPQPEGRRLEPFYVVARRALASIRPLGKLPFVRIRLVTIHALLESKRLLEITALVTALALYGLVLAQQGILRLRMIEAFVYRLG
jgi:hypothetical protein